MHLQKNIRVQTCSLMVGSHSGKLERVSMTIRNGTVRGPFAYLDHLPTTEKREEPHDGQNELSKTGQRINLMCVPQ